MRPDYLDRLSEYRFSSKPMDPERRLRIESLYHAAYEREPHLRGEFLAEVCPDDELDR